MDDVDYVVDMADILIKLMPAYATPSMITLFHDGSIVFVGYSHMVQCGTIIDLFPVKACLLRDKDIWSVTMTRNALWGLSIYTTYRDNTSGKAVRGDGIDLWFKNNIIVT